MNMTTLVLRVAARPGIKIAGRLERRPRRLNGIAIQHIATRATLWGQAFWPGPRSGVPVTFLDQIRQTIARFSMLRSGDSLGVAVSGGTDSVCLLHILLELRAELDLTLAVIHVDHHLRGPQSQADAQFVHKSAQQLSLPFHLRTLDLDPRRGNLEQEARRARHQFFHDLVRGGVVQKVAVGHTRSDQAETVLFRFLRGAGSAGLAGIRPVTDVGIIRPLLQVTRLQVEGWLKERNISWREDSTNAELRFDRNRIRHQLIPQLEAEWNPGLSETLAQTADWAFEEEQHWRQEIPRLMADWVCFAKDAAVLDANRLTAHPVAVIRRLIREIVLQVKYDLLGINFAHIEAIRHLATHPDGDGRVQIPGLEIIRSFNWLRFAKPGPPDQNWQVCVTGPGRYVVPSTAIELELVSNKDVYNRDGNVLDWEKAGDITLGPLVLRNWRPGDHYQRQGHAGPEKIKDLFQEYRIPLWERQNLSVIAVGDSIAWTDRFGPAAQFAVDADSRTVLRIQSEPRDFG
jgi:tRNA(Ile)-lysidine synthase